MPRKPKAPPADVPYLPADLQGLAVPIDQLKLDPRNARVHNEQNVQAIAGSLKRFGQLKPIVAHAETKIVEAGNGVLLAAKRLGWTHLAVVWMRHDAAEALGFALADNRSAELATWDDAQLQSILAEVEEGLAELYDDLRLADLRQPEAKEARDGNAPGREVPAIWQIVVDCAGEEDQKALFERLKGEGRACRLLVL
jgi:ParB-like chromosome segregation protein Spo0J